MDDETPRLRTISVVPLLMIVAIAAYRWAPHPWNVAPVGALFALSGLYVTRRWIAWVAPLAAVVASDIPLYLRFDGTLLHADRLVDYMGFALVLLIGRACAGRALAARAGAVLAAPVVFYLVSNFGVWLVGEVGYPHTLGGLADCYLAGVPFFRGTLAGDWLFGLGGMAVIEGLPRLGRPAGSGAQGRAA
jgi:hypothetical protein